MSRILVVDDHDDTRAILLALLRRNGHEVWTAENGAVALRLAERHRPDVVLMDLSMPVMDGWTAAAHLRRDPPTPDLKIVAVTAQILMQQHRGLATQLFDFVITKPIAPADVLDRLGHLGSPPEQAASGAIPST